MPQFKANVLKADVKLIQGDSIYSQYGNWPVWAVVMLMGLLGIIIGSRR
jgi:apolipoprotein N-acyltransferase